MGRFPLVHTLGTSLVNHTLGIADDTIVMFGSHGFQKLYASNPSRTGTV